MKGMTFLLTAISVAVLFMVINTFILGQPMALRHTH